MPHYAPLEKITTVKQRQLTARRLALTLFNVAKPDEPLLNRPAAVSEALSWPGECHM